MWSVYLLRTRDGSLYTGIATRVERRLIEHRSSSGRGAKALRGKAPLRVVFQRPVGDRALALKVERCIKRLSKQRKEQLVEANPETRQLLEFLAVPYDG